MKIFSLILFQFCFIVSMYSQQFIPLWPSGKIPNSRGMQLEHIEERERITQVSEPGMYVFFTSKDDNKGSAVLICPPGGYAKLSYNIAGFQFAKWLNTLGINAFVLIYRLPTSPDLIEREKGSIQDAQRAMKIIRANSTAWHINTSKIGVMGASAGGHLASTLGTQPSDYSLVKDSVDAFSYDPNFMILISPVISMGKYAHQGSRDNLLGNNTTEENVGYYSTEQQVTRNTPPTFIVVAQNDPVVNPMNSLLFYQAMLKNEIPGSLHVFPQGEHSIALQNFPRSVNLWTTLCEEWLRNIGVINNAKD